LGQFVAAFRHVIMMLILCKLLPFKVEVKYNGVYHCVY